MDTKKCFKCGAEKPLSEFYVHKAMGDGHLGKCKDCTRLDARKHHKENRDKIKAYDKGRAMLPHRVKARSEYVKTKAGKEAVSRGNKKYKLRNPEKVKAHVRLRNAIRGGLLERPDKCEVCGIECKPHAHHWSYEEEHWLDVQWVCVHCHIDIHKER